MSGRSGIWRRIWRGAIGTVWPAGLSVIDRFNRAGGTVLSGYFAYIAMLALFPFLIFATALSGFFIGSENSAAAIDVIFEPFPEHVKQTLEPVIYDVIGQRRSGVLTFAALGALWAASNGLEAIRLGFDDAYAVTGQRRYAVNRVLLFALVLLCVMGFVLLAGLVILAPLAIHLVEQLLGTRLTELVDYTRYGLSAVILFGLLWTMHRMLPSRAMGGMRLWPGVLASALVWAAAAGGMSVYLAYAPAYSLTYGALAGVIVTLLFFYLTGVALLLGAHVNAVVNRLPPPRAAGAAPAGDENGDGPDQI